MKLVRHILEEKGNKVVSVTPSAIIYDALKIMAENKIGALLVTEQDKILGIFTERDYARKVILHGKSSRELKVSDIMSDKVYYLQPCNTVDECMAVMTEKRVRHLPVLEEGRLIGIISIGDAVKALIDDQNLMIEHLVNFIKGC